MCIRDRLVPGLLAWPDRLLALLKNFTGIALLGPRSGSKTESLSIPNPLPPGIANFDCKVSYVETFPAGSERPLIGGGSVRTWLETVESAETVIEATDGGSPVLLGDGNLRYLAGWPDTKAMTRIIAGIADELELDARQMPEGVRRRCTGSHEFIFNHNAVAATFAGEKIDAAGVVIRRLA